MMKTQTILAGLMAPMVLAATTQAAVLTWAPGSATWQDGQQNNFDALWSNTNPDSAVFTGSANTTYTVTVNGSIDLLNLTFNTGVATTGPKYTITGGSLNFATGGAIANSNNAFNQTITSTITGSPSVNVFDGAQGNTYEGIIFAPGTGQTQTLGAILNPIDTVTGTKDKSGVYLSGETTGNTVASIDYGAALHYGTVYKQGAGTWTVNGILHTGTLRVSAGTLIVNGNTTLEYSGLVMSGTGVLAGNTTVFKNDRRSTNDFVSGTGIAPGNSVGTLTFDWGMSGTPSAAQWITAFRAGSHYDWDVLSAASTDKVHIVDGRLVLEGFTLKIQDAGASTTILATDPLPVFTYGTLDAKTLSLGSVIFDTSALGAGWSWSNLALTDDTTNKVIYLTGLSYAVPEPASLAFLGLGGLLIVGRRRS